MGKLFTVKRPKKARYLTCTVLASCLGKRKSWVCGKTLRFGGTYGCPDTEVRVFIFPSRRVKGTLEFRRNTVYHRGCLLSPVLVYECKTM